MAIFGNLFGKGVKTGALPSQIPATEPAVTASELFGLGGPPVMEDQIIDPPSADLTWALAERPPQTGDREPDPIVVPDPPVVTAPEPVAVVRDIASLLGDFETLGPSPEFSVLRQTLGAGADGLFGFSTMSAAALLAMLQSRFEGVGTHEAIRGRVAGGRYYLADPRHGFDWETDIAADSMAPAAAIAQEADRLAPLCQELIAHLTENGRLFVYAGLAHPETLAAIRAAMRAFGNNALLHVVEGDTAHAPGAVMSVEPGLYRGYLTRYASRDGICAVAVDEWVAICGQAHALWTQPDVPA
jgi:hypothetical protein